MTDQMMRFDAEYRRQLYDRLEKRLKSFATLYKTTTIFAFAFLAFVLIPLVGLQHDERKFKDISTQYKNKKEELDKKGHQIQAIQENKANLSSLLEKKKHELDTKEGAVGKINIRLEQIEFDIDKNTSRFNLNKEKALAFSDIRSQFNALPVYSTKESAEKLRNSLAKIASYAVSSEDLSRLPQNDRCRTAPDINEYVKCKTRDTIQVNLEAYRAVIEKADLELEGYVTLEGRKRIDDRIKAVLAVLERKLREKPDFWHSYREKTFFFREFEDPMENVFNEIARQLEQYKDALDEKKQEIFKEEEKLNNEGRRLEKLLADNKQYRDDIAKEIGDMEGEVANLNQEYIGLENDLKLTKEAITPLENAIDNLKQIIDEIPQAKENIEARLENVQTPFGTLPVGLNEALLVFPILIAAGLMICCYILAEVIRLRREYHLETYKQFPDDTEEIDGGIKLVAPIWIDPYGEKSTNWGRLTLLCLPVLAYGIALGLIFYSWYLGGTQPGSTAVIRGGYTLLYLLGIGGFVIAAYRISTEWRQYRDIGTVS